MIFFRFAVSSSSVGNEADFARVEQSFVDAVALTQRLSKERETRNLRSQSRYAMAVLPVLPALELQDNKCVD